MPHTACASSPAIRCWCGRGLLALLPFFTPIRRTSLLNGRNGVFLRYCLLYEAMGLETDLSGAFEAVLSLEHLVTIQCNRMHYRAEMAKKRSDLQGIRGIAIVAVLLFHYFPKIFPNGYIGVDQFFVLSGYLMTMIFAGSKSSIIKSALSFYYRRVKRIIPLYLLVIVLVLMAVIVLLPPTFVLLNLESARAAALLYTNMATRSKENQYFVQLNQADDLFTHTWSLAVEFQFYLLVPFIFLIYQVDSNTFHWIVILIIEAFSFTYYLVADPNVSFNSVFCRIWQFGIGIACYMISDLQNDSNESTKHEAPHNNDQKTGIVAQEDDTIEKKMLAVLSVVVTVLLIALALSTYPIPKDVLRPFTTLLTGIVIAVGSLTPCCILTLRALVFLGDISYALYLVHWPVFVLIRFYAPEKSSAYLFAISCCIAGATLLYYTFERWYLSMTPGGIYILIAAMYAIIAVLILKGEDISNRLYELRSGSSVNSDFVASRWTNMTIDEAIAVNEKFARYEYKYLVAPHCQPNKTEHGFCSFEKQTLKGNLTILIIGNSYAANAAELIYETFGRLARNISKFSQSSCEALVITNKGCKSAYDKYLEYAESIKPDILFIVTRMFTMTSGFSKPVRRDRLVAEARAVLQKYASLERTRVYVLDAIPGVDSDHISALNAALKTESDLAEIRPPAKQMTGYFNARRRTSELKKSCAKCTFFDYADELSDGNGSFLLYDPATKVSFFTGGSHLTEAGLQKIRPVYERIAKQLAG